jgi:hypothetical protein
LDRTNATDRDDRCAHAFAAFAGFAISIRFAKCVRANAQSAGVMVDEFENRPRRHAAASS